MQRRGSLWSGVLKWLAMVRQSIGRPNKGTGTVEQKYRIFILGAGFSRPAGLPLAGELWTEVQKRAKRLGGRAQKFTRDLDDYLTFKKECEGIEVSPERIDFEDFLAFLDVEHHLGLRGSDTWSADGNEGQVVVKTLIGKILTEAMPRADAIPRLYLKFAEALQPHDYVLTFNYDVLLERALKAIRKPFRLFPDRYERVGRNSAILDLSHDEVIVLKMHGSIDWFDRRQYRELEEGFARQGLTSKPRHPVFSNVQDLGVVPIVEGPRYPDDPLLDMHRVTRIERLYAVDILFHAAPWLLNPSMAKILYYEKLRDFWFGLGAAGGLNLGLAIIGYSLPAADAHARRIIYQIVKNYERAFRADQDLGRRKTPIVLVDYRRTPAEIEDFRRRYGFVDGKHSKVVLTGFDEDVVTLFEI
jgi:hypothetical protein